MDKKDLLVSVIVPVYNVEKYISECIQSIIGQSYKNLEIIIINDGSPDNSAQIINEYANKDKRIRVIHQKNNGVASARNKGIDNATGDFIIFVDSDDYITSDHVSHLLGLQRIMDADMCMTTQFYTQKHDTQEKTERVYTISAEKAASLLLSPKVVVGSYNKLYRRAWLIANKIRQNEKLFSGEGLNFIVTAAQYANCVTVSNRKIYYYRRNVSESATTKFNIKMFTNNELSLDLITTNLIIRSSNIERMLNLFRVHLMINGILAILTYSTPEQHLTEYNRWIQTLHSLGCQLLLDSQIPLKSKIRIIGVSISPYAWAKIAKFKRDRIFKESI